MVAVEWVDHMADVGFRVRGDSREAIFESAAHALFSIMLDVATVRVRTRHSVQVSANRLEELLVEWLSELLAQKDLNGQVFSHFQVNIDERDGSYRLIGDAWGELLDRDRHQPKTEVKGVSYLGLRVGMEQSGLWIAQVVVDV